MLSNHNANIIKTFFFKILCDCFLIDKKKIFLAVATYYTCSASRGKSSYFQEDKKVLRIFQRFRLVKFIEKFKTRVKNLKIEKIIAFNRYLHELFFAFYFHHSKN